MTSEIPPWLGYVVGGTLFCLVGIVLFSILIYALRESKRVAEQEARQRDQPPRAAEAQSRSETEPLNDPNELPEERQEATQMVDQRQRTGDS